MLSRITLFFLLSLTFTNLGLFQLGNAKFTVFHAVFILVFIRMLMMQEFKIRNIPKSFFLLILYGIAHFTFIQSEDWNSFVYFILTSLFIYVLFQIIHTLKHEQIERILKIIILLFFINTVIGFFLIQVDFLPVGFFKNIIGVYKDPGGEIRPHAFVDEPSYCAILLVFVLLVLFRLHNFSIIRENIKWYLMTIFSILLVQSSYGYLFFLVFTFLLFIRKFNPIFLLFIVFSVIIATLFIGEVVFSFRGFERLKNLFTTFSQSNGVVSFVDEMKYTDGSASMRIFPTLELINHYQNSSWSQILFGFGFGKSELFFSELIKLEKINLGLIPAFVYNMGLIGFSLVVITIYKFISTWKVAISLLMILFLLNADFNTQIFVAILGMLFFLSRLEILGQKN